MGSEMKTQKMYMTPYTIPRNIYLTKDSLKEAEGPPDLLRGHLFEPGAGSGGQIRKLVKSK